MEPNHLWVKVIKAIHHSNRKIVSIPVKKTLTGVWKNIGEIGKEFMKYNVDVTKSLKSKVGLGDKTMFWVETWLGNEPLLVQFPGLYQLALNKKALVKDCYRVNNVGKIWDWGWVRAPNCETEIQEMNALNTMLQQQSISLKEDEWFWKNSEQEGFTVRGVRQSLASQINLNEQANEFVWNRWATAKSVMFVWRAVDGRIPTATALRERGMVLTDYNCKLCGAAEETVSHLLLQCSFAKEIWEKIVSWVKIPMFTAGNLRELMQELQFLQRSRYIKKAIHTIATQTIWSIWKIRNEKIFRGKSGAIQTTIEEIKEATFQGVKLRSKFKRISRQEWWDFNVILS
ncbi:uncharacterized protein LOC110933944 [Helianthus annuus]|uniref:uncharacterized protein LOC110933944 n=1 Tax=Helianthus annuus TaxID=4232 RepID=UPI000B901C9B|nr:uncharacterized protein LOC110933944 [Helianthus annuus]